MLANGHYQHPLANPIHASTVPTPGPHPTTPSVAAPIMTTPPASPNDPVVASTNPHTHQPLSCSHSLPIPDRYPPYQHCVFCPLRSGAMRPISPKADVWAHVVCARYFDRGQDPAALARSAAAFSAKTSMPPCSSYGCAAGSQGRQHHHPVEEGMAMTPRCYLCPRPAEAIFGSLLSCASQTCPFQFHASCAHSVGLIQFDSPSPLKSKAGADSNAPLTFAVSEVAPAVPAVFCHQHARQATSPGYGPPPPHQHQHLARNPWFEWSMQRNQCTAQPMSPRYEAPAPPAAHMDWSSDDDDDDDDDDDAHILPSRSNTNKSAETSHSHPHLHPLSPYDASASTRFASNYPPPYPQPVSGSSSSNRRSPPPYPPPTTDSSNSARRGSASGGNARGRRRSIPETSATSLRPYQPETGPSRPPRGSGATPNPPANQKRANWDRDGSLSPLLQSSRASSSLPGAVTDDDGGDDYDFGGNEYKRRRRGSSDMSSLPPPAATDYVYADGDQEGQRPYYNGSTAAALASSAPYPPPTSPMSNVHPHSQSPGRRSSAASGYDGSTIGSPGFQASSHRAPSPYNPVSAAAAAAHHRASLEFERHHQQQQQQASAASEPPTVQYTHPANSRLQPLPEIGPDGLEIIQLQPLRLHRDGSEFADVLATHETYVPEAKPGTELVRGELRFPGDLYSPIWKRGTARKKEALCRLCPPEQWYCVKISAYWYHLHFLHGVSSTTGLPFTGPVTERYNAEMRIREGQCHKCNKWIALDPARPTVVKVPEIYWWKHAQKCHSKK